MSFWWSWSEPQRDGEEVAAARRILREVDEPRDDVAAVVHFRIESVVSRNDEQIAAAHAEIRAAHAESLERIQALLRDVVAQRDLANLHERSVEQVDTGVGAARPRVVAVRA